MKKIKLLFLGISLLFLTGCDFVYDIDIDNGIVKEDNQIILSQESDNIENDVLNLIHKYTGPTDSLGMYTPTGLDNGMSYSAKYELSDFNDSITFSMCYKAFKLLNNSKTIEIATSKQFLCYDMYEELENVTINLTTQYEVISSNADYVDDDTYTWYITKDNASDKAINIILDKTTNDGEENKKDNDIFIIIIILGSILVIGVFGYMYFKAKSLASNKI